MNDGDDLITALREADELRREIAHHEAVAVLCAEATRSREVLREAIGRLGRSPARGSPRWRGGVSLIRASRHLDSAAAAIGDADWGLPVSELTQRLDLARGFLWLAALDIGAGLAQLPSDEPHFRRWSRASELAQLARAHPGLSAAKLNAMLSVPIDPSTARRVLRELRGVRK